MGLVNFVLSSIGVCTEIVCFLLDLNFIIVHSLIRFVVACVAFVNSLPTLLTSVAVGCWNSVVFCLISLADGASAGTQMAVSLLGAVLESLKMAGHLSSHVCLRGRELLHRAVLSTCEGCGAAASLAVHLVNSAVDLLLLGAQILFAPLQTALELVLTLLAFLRRALVGVSVLLWSPCCQALEGLVSVAQFLLSVFILNVYGLLLTASVSLAAALYLHPALARRGARRLTSVPVLRAALGALRRLQRPLSRVPGAARRLQRALWRLYLQERGVWRRWSRQDGRLGQGLGSRLRLALRLGPGRGPGLGDDRVAGDGGPGQGEAGRRPPPEGRAGVGPPPEGRAGVGAPEEHPRGHPQHQQRRLPEELALPGPSSTDRPLQKLCARGEEGEAGPGSAHSLLSRLKEQEERKRCVICQDCYKTVVLLPCRHLCLCRDCTRILLRQPVYLHNCPLCRRMILSTMDVFL